MSQFKTHSMGWLDYHLHIFNVLLPRKRKPILIGMPHEDDTEKILPDFEISIRKYFCIPGGETTYGYDFGDGWNYQITLEGICLAKDKIKYPHCIDGELACPPEDCGGVSGYERLLKILEDPKNKKHGQVYWLESHNEVKPYPKYNSEQFKKPSDVNFWNPQ